MAVEQTAALAARFDRMLRELRIESKPTLSQSLVLDEIVRMRRKGLSHHAIATALNEAGWPTARGGNWYGATVRDLLIQHGPDRLAREATKSSVAAEIIDGIDRLIAERQAGR